MLAGAFVVTSCGGGWIKASERGLAATAAVSRAIVKTTRGDQFCRPILDKCKAAKTNPCPNLAKCHQAQKALLEGAAELVGPLKKLNLGLTLARGLK